ncbi:hypothetical protein FHS16_004572 [Paenibacillus endophyticus]|uniref:Uncharacterized protein n=1 Tax=Paenibacillus endophyticus TaxID=1294268 RepID=A0A7W5CB68_9BACL|nr:hypothetical protein [Paenibacillus endophyticus]MBB3154490.1 hypothetical protein [Paenibacillus endophyticus]
MNDTTEIQKKVDTIIVSVDALTNTITSTMARCEERLISLEQTLWVVQKKIIDQDKLLEALSSNIMIDELVKRRELQSKIKQLKDQSEEYRRSTGRAIREDDDED